MRSTKRYGSGPTRKHGAPLGSPAFSSPLASVRRRYAEAVRLPEPPAPVRTLADMGPEEIAALERQYGARVAKP